MYQGKRIKKYFNTIDSRGSKDRKSGNSPVLMVSAWACANRLVLGQEATAEKSNEITAIPKLWEWLDIKGGWCFFLSNEGQRDRMQFDHRAFKC